MRNGQNDQKTVNCVKDFFHKINKYIQRKPGIKCFIFAGIMSLTPDSELNNFTRTDHNTTSVCTRLFSHKVIKTMT